jgi:transposase
VAAQGHEVRLMSPEHVRPYAEAMKNDDRDAEAATRPTIRFVKPRARRSSTSSRCAGRPTGWWPSERR